MYIYIVKFTIVISLLTAISDFDVLGQENINQAFFFVNESNCPDCRIPKIRSLNNDIKLLIPEIITNIVYNNFDIIRSNVDYSKFNFVDKLIKDSEADILEQYFGVKKNESKLIIRFNDSLKKTIFFDNLYELNFETFSNILRDQMKNQDVNIQSSDLNNYHIGNIIFKDKSNGDSTIIFDYNSKKSFIYNNNENLILKEIEFPDSIKFDYLKKIDPILINTEKSGTNFFEIINIVEFKEHKITYQARFLHDYRIDTTFEMYNNKLETILTLNFDYIKVLLQYNIINNTIKYDTLPHKISNMSNLYELYSYNNLYNFTTVISIDTNINNLSNQIDMFGIYDPKFDKVSYLNSKSVLHLLDKPFLKKSIFGFQYNHNDSSYIILNLRNKLLFNYKLNNEIININYAAALKYILSDDSLKNNYYLLTKYKYEDNDLINISADNKYIYILLSYRDIVTHKMQLILQKYKLNGNIFSEEVLKFSNDNVLNFQFIQTKNNQFKALVNTSENGWQILKYQN